MGNVKQVIVVRKDLNMRKGKMVAQGAHASMKVVLDLMQRVPGMKYLHSKGEDGELLLSLRLQAKTPLDVWLNGTFTKICLSVDSEAELDAIYNKAKEAGIPCAMIIDSGLTEFNGVPTKTCIAIGPDIDTNIDQITGHLKLL